MSIIKASDLENNKKSQQKKTVELEKKFNFISDQIAIQNDFGFTDIMFNCENCTNCEIDTIKTELKNSGYRVYEKNLGLFYQVPYLKVCWGKKSFSEKFLNWL